MKYPKWALMHVYSELNVSICVKYSWDSLKLISTNENDIMNQVVIIDVNLMSSIVRH